MIKQKNMYKLIKSNDGSITIEVFCFVLPTFIILLLFHILCYTWVTESITALYNLRNDLRISVEENSEGEFNAVIIKDRVFVQIPGKFKHFLNMAYLSKNIKLFGYQGCYRGIERNQYRKVYREVKLQNKEYK